MKNHYFLICWLCLMFWNFSVAQSDPCTNALAENFDPNAAPGNSENCDFNWVTCSPQSFSYCYDNNEDLTVTFCSDAPADRTIALTITGGSIENFFDDFILFDGSGTAAPAIVGPLSGPIPTGTYFATNPDACLTLRIESDFTISCASGAEDPLEFSIQCVTQTDCAVTNVTATNVGSCDPDDGLSYAVDLEITYDQAPTTGDLLVNGTAFPITQSPQTVTLAGLYSDGLPVNVEVRFSDDLLCGGDFNNVFTSPANCQPGQTCGEAIPITANGTYDAPAAVAGDGCISCQYGSLDAVFYEFTAPADGRINISSCAGEVPTNLNIYTGGCSNPELVQTGQPFCQTTTYATYASLVYNVPVSAGETYYIEWSQWHPEPFIFDFEFIAGACAPANATCETATAITTSFCTTTPADNTCSTMGLANSCEQWMLSLDLYYSFVATTEAAAVMIELGTATEVGVALYEECAAFNYINTCLGSTADGSTNFALEDLTVGETYVLQFYSPLDAGGTFDFCVDETCTVSEIVAASTVCDQTAGTFDQDIDVTLSCGGLDVSNATLTLALDQGAGYQTVGTFPVTGSTTTLTAQGLPNNGNVYAASVTLCMDQNTTCLTYEESVLFYAPNPDCSPSCPNLTITGAEVSSTGPFLTDLQVTVQNTGTAALTLPNELIYFYEEAITFAIIVSEDDQFDLDNQTAYYLLTGFYTNTIEDVVLGAGESTTLYASIGFDIEAFPYFRIVADWDDALLECDETDNTFDIVVPLPCEQATEVRAIAITDNSAELYWPDISGVTDYQLQYREGGTTTWTTEVLPTGTIGFPLTDLESETTYEARYRSVCLNGNESPYSPITSFTTLSCTNSLTLTGPPSWLPDGGDVYNTSTITVDSFAAGQVLNAYTSIASVCITIEHSWVGDLSIELICPDSSIIYLLGTENMGLGPGSDLGLPAFNDVGTGYTYCFTPTADQTLLDFLTTGGFLPTVPPDNYLPEQPYTDLNGCPLNGDWTLSIYDNFFGDDGFLFGWSITFASTPPQVMSQPATTAAQPGSTASFSLAVSGSAPSYQWMSSADGTSYQPVPGANAATLHLDNVSMSQNGTYYMCFVENGCGVTATDPAQLFVTETGLALDLLDFSGRATARGNQLRWTVANAVNIAHYQIEHKTSTSGSVQRSEQIGHSRSTAYEWWDDRPAPRTYYRLLWTETTGKMASSDWILLEQATKDEATVLVYPNPTDGSFELSAATPIQHIDVLDAYGKRVQTFQPDASTMVSMNLSQLPRGIYVLHLQTEQGWQRSRVVLE